MGDMETEILGRVGKSGDAGLDTLDLARELGLEHGKLVGLVMSLSSDELCRMEQRSTKRWELTEEGLATVENGSPELQLVKALVAAGGTGINKNEAKKTFAVGMGVAMKNKWLNASGEAFTLAVPAESIVDELATELNKLQVSGGAEESVSKDTINNLKRRNQIKLATTTHFGVTKGPKWAPQRVKQISQLTKEMLESGEWETALFKPLNLHALGPELHGGFLHPLLQVRTEFRKILVGMGFEEMPTSKWVENSFWNFDSLFQPQQHPARDAHDTFFIKEPQFSSLESLPAAFVEDVKNMHQSGGYGSIGHRYLWSLEESKKNILRTHTTAISSQMLYRLAHQPGGFKPAKYFSIDRVFRNEAMDRTHLAEFHQVEGLVADYNLSLGDLIGVIKQFFLEIGIQDVRFKPAFNPYTEPSMEIFGYHPDLKKWTEIGNSGMFRPEMLRPLGLPEGVRVIAWGLALERPTMIKFRVKDIRELFGHKIKLEKNKVSQLPLFKEPSPSALL